MTSIIVSRRQLTALRLRTFYGGGEKMEGRIQQRLPLSECARNVGAIRKTVLGHRAYIMKLCSWLLLETAELLVFLNKNISPIRWQRRPIV